MIENFFFFFTNKAFLAIYLQKPQNSGEALKIIQLQIKDKKVAQST